MIVCVQQHSNILGNSFVKEQGKSIIHTLWTWQLTKENFHERERNFQPYIALWTWELSREFFHERVAQVKQNRSQTVITL